MITIQNGKILIPQNEELIGIAGDNKHTTKQFIITDSTGENWIYRIYLKFDDNTVNYFVLDSTKTKDGTLLTWLIEDNHIFKSGLVRIQIKAFSNDNEIYHTNTTTLIVGNSIEYGDSFKNYENSEFLKYEKLLNQIYRSVVSASSLPYIGSNNNWFVYSVKDNRFIDSGVCAKGEIGEIADYSLTSSKLADGCVTSSKIANGSITKEKLSDKYLPIYKKTYTQISEINFDEFTTEGIYQLDCYTGDHIVLGVLKPNTDAYIFQTRYEYNAIYYRGYWGPDWEPWQELGNKEIEDGSITTTKIGRKTITADNIANDTINTENLKNGIITTAKLTDSSVKNTKIDDSAVTTQKVADNAITTQKLANDVFSYINEKSIENLKQLDSDYRNTNEITWSDDIWTTDISVFDNWIDEGKLYQTVLTEDALNYFGCVKHNGLANTNLCFVETKGINYDGIDYTFLKQFVTIFPDIRNQPNLCKQYIRRSVGVPGSSGWAWEDKWEEFILNKEYIDGKALELGQVISSVKEYKADKTYVDEAIQTSILDCWEASY